MKPCPRLALRCAGAALAAWTAAACRASITTTAPSPLAASPVPWAEGDVLRAQPISGAGAAARVARLDALLDLLDAARFADDADARERLWVGLGGTPRARGPEATRDASVRLLSEAIQLDITPGLDEDAHDFVSGVIAVLSADLVVLGAAEDLAIRTAAYRAVAEHGHPRAADNARWRLYDHVRGCLVGARRLGPAGASPRDRRPQPICPRGQPRSLARRPGRARPEPAAEPRGCRRCSPRPATRWVSTPAGPAWWPAAPAPTRP